MSLKELTMQQHRDAERQKFAGVLMSGKISKKTYFVEKIFSTIKPLQLKECYLRFFCMFRSFLLQKRLKSFLDF